MENNELTIDEKEGSLFSNHLQAIGKLDYAKGKRPKVDCILCAIRENDERVTSLKIYQDDILFVSLNLYPYNPGHLMVVPNKHVENFEDLTREERNHLFNVILATQQLLRDELTPTGFNVGYNQGEFSGASIKHIHAHVVPRYPSELGFMDIIGKTKVIVESVSSIEKKLKPKIAEYIKKFNK